MCDAVFTSFLERSLRDAMAVSAASDRLRVTPLPPQPPSAYVLEFAVPYLRRLASGSVELAPGPVEVGLRFPAHYLRAPGDPWLALTVASMITPDVFHPNVAPPRICLGARFTQGTPLRQLLWHLWDIVTYANVTVDEREALVPEACRLLREHPALLARLTPPPLRRARPRRAVTVAA